VILALAAAVAIVSLDHTALRAAPHSSGTELAALWQGDVLEVRDERPGYLKVYDYRRERGGYVKAGAVHPVQLTEAGAPELLAVLRFLRETPGSEALGISYGAAYLKAAPAPALTAEPFDAIARMAERLADKASGSANHLANFADHLEVVQQFGIRMRTVEINGRMQVCYDGELFRRVLSMKSAAPEERAHAALGLTRTDCIDPGLGPTRRATLDDERRSVLDDIKDPGLSAMTRSRIHARRAGLYASMTYAQARRGEPTGEMAERALAELLAVHAGDLGDEFRAEYKDAQLRVSAIRWGGQISAPLSGPWALSASAGDPGQTCVTLEDTRRRGAPPLLRRCTYGIVWMASAKTLAQGRALVLAVQPLESWRELWVFRQKSDAWTLDVLSPGANDPEEGYVDFAGFAPGPGRLLTVREVKDHGQYQRRFEEFRLADLALVRQANSADSLRDFGPWQDAAWRRDTLALR
jgi:hypothetical protein